MSDTRKAIDLLKSFTGQDDLEKAQSAGVIVAPSETQAKREYGHSFARFPRGESGEPTPDLPEQGKDWHGTVPGVPDEPQDEEGDQQGEDEAAFKDPENITGEKKGPPEPVNLMASTQEIQDKTNTRQQQQPAAPPIAAKSLNELARKALAGAPRFSSGPIMPPRERKFLIEQGFSPEDVDAGVANMTPRMRGQFNRDLQSTVQKSIAKLAEKIESK